MNVHTFFLLRNPHTMMALKNLWLRGTGSGESCASPFRNEHLVACDVLMTELDFHIKELEYIKQEQKQEERRLKTGMHTQNNSCSATSIVVT